MVGLHEAPETASRVVFTALGLIDTFTPEQRREALIDDFADPRRCDWDIIPKPDRSGVPLHHLDRYQRVLVWDLIRQCVPRRTFTKILAITQLEHVLRDYEGAVLGPSLQAWRTADNYFLTIFGRPGFEETWTLRFLGHHVCLNLTIIRERWIAATPMALGQQPTEYDGVLHPLADDEGLGFALLNSLDAGQRAAACIHTVAPADFVTRQTAQIGAYEYADVYDLGMPAYSITDDDRRATKFTREQPSGINGADLSDEQQQTLWSLLDCYLQRIPDECIPAHRDALRAAGIERVHFAWAGARMRGAPHYFRVHTDRYLIEAVNSVGNGNHLHTVLRDFTADFGFELLKDPAYDARRNLHLSSRTTSSADLDPLGDDGDPPAP